MFVSRRSTNLLGSIRCDQHGSSWIYYQLRWFSFCGGACSSRKGSFISSSLPYTLFSSFSPSLSLLFSYFLSLCVCVRCVCVCISESPLIIPKQLSFFVLPLPILSTLSSFSFVLSLSVCFPLWLIQLDFKTSWLVSCCAHISHLLCRKWLLLKSYTSSIISGDMS